VGTGSRNDATQHLPASVGYEVAHRTLAYGIRVRPVSARLEQRITVR
jgi:hypothetical protein